LITPDRQVRIRQLFDDTHGHAAGDFLLIEVANRLRAGVGAMDTVARKGVMSLS
jgi:GGDEF domain-containing protein